MDIKTVRKFQGILAAANIPTNPATAEAILTLARLTLDGIDPSIGDIHQLVDDINTRTLKEVEAAKANRPTPTIPLKGK